MRRTRRNPWDAVLKVIQRLRAGGHVALLAGGCVRDRLLGHAPKDYDVVTDAVPERVLELFPRGRKVGAKFGVILVRQFGHDFEVATFRADGPYSNGRRPDAVRFGSDLDDARRRDFTVNGLFLDPIEDRIIDHVGGRKDIEARIVRTIGEPELRFAEDHLRMLRAVRFSARLGFTIEPETADAIRALAHNLGTISPERIWMELELILTDPTRAHGWELLIKAGLRSHLSTAWPPTPAADSTILARLSALSTEPITPALALASVLEGLDPTAVPAVCGSLRLSNKLSKTVQWLLASLQALHAEHTLDLAALKTLMADDAWADLLELFRADLAAKTLSPAPYDAIKARAEAIPKDRVAPPPLLDGDRLTAMGLEPGPRMGEILAAVYREQLNENLTTPQHAEALARQLIGE
ncbi:MAG: CCA tRNA nucleotidyltransferase [Phycisphaerae bacterium]|jgi:poly(A) polymerase